jgi:hypothetical protein
MKGIPEKNRIVRTKLDIYVFIFYYCQMGNDCIMA